MPIGTQNRDWQLLQKQKDRNVCLSLWLCRNQNTLGIPRPEISCQTSTVEIVPTVSHTPPPQKKHLDHVVDCLNIGNLCNSHGSIVVISCRIFVDVFGFVQFKALWGFPSVDCSLVSGCLPSLLAFNFMNAVTFFQSPPSLQWLNQLCILRLFVVSGSFAPSWDTFGRNL